MMIRLVLILVVAAIIAGIGYGAIAIYQHMHHLTGTGRPASRAWRAS